MINKLQNKIYVFVNGDNQAILKFDKCNIETQAYIGRNGITAKKIEGDGKTPIGNFKLGIILGTHSHIENKNRLKYITINEHMYWIDDIKSKYYNLLVDSTKVQKDWDTAEHLVEYPIQYEYLIEIKVNPRNIKGNGSAIFLHCINNGHTAGCVAISKENMKRIIENIDKNTEIEICATKKESKYDLSPIY